MKYMKEKINLLHTTIKLQFCVAIKQRSCTFNIRKAVWALPKSVSHIIQTLFIYSCRYSNQHQKINANFTERKVHVHSKETHLSIR